MNATEPFGWVGKSSQPHFHDDDCFLLFLMFILCLTLLIFYRTFYAPTVKCLTTHETKVYEKCTKQISIISLSFSLSTSNFLGFKPKLVLFRSWIGCYIYFSTDIFNCKLDYIGSLEYVDSSSFKKLLQICPRR